MWGYPRAPGKSEVGDRKSHGRHPRKETKKEESDRSKEQTRIFIPTLEQQDRRKQLIVSPLHLKESCSVELHCLTVP